MLTGRLLILSKKEAECKEMTAYFEDSGYNVIWCTEYDEAGEILSRGKNKPDLLIFDVDIPKRREYETVEKIRMYSDMAILMLSQDDKLDSQLYAYSKKIDDYMVKPIDINEMLFRINALLRRAKSVSEKRLSFGNTTLEYGTWTVTDNTGTQILPQKEFQLLYKLLSYPGQIFTRQQILDEIWGIEQEDSHTLDVHISRLRERFKENNDFEIVTIRGLGYRAVKK